MTFSLTLDDSDEDPEFVPPEHNQGANDHETSDSSSLEEEETVLAHSPASLAFYSSSAIASTSSRCRSRG